MAPGGETEREQKRGESREVRTEKTGGLGMENKNERKLRPEPGRTTEGLARRTHMNEEPKPHVEHVLNSCIQPAH